jgi:hypothetical protein
MISVDTRFGFTLNIDECVIKDNYVFTDLVACISDEDEDETTKLVASRKLHILLFGKLQRKELIKFLEEKYGVATNEQLNEAVTDVFTAIGKDNELKKSSPSQE